MSKAETNPHICITREEVMFFDTDCGGVVHNLAYLRMVEVCRTKLAAQLGMDLKTMAETQVFPVVVSTDARYRKPAKLGDTIIITGRLAEVERARFWCEFELHCLDSSAEDERGTHLLSARQSLAVVQMPQGKPMRLKGNAGIVGL